MTEVLHKNWGGVLMIGGHGQRMGGIDKSALTLKNATFREIGLKRLESRFDHVAVSARQSKIDTPSTETSTEAVADITINGKSIGPAGGLLAALTWANDLGLSGIVTLPVDTPILSTGLCETLCASGKTCYAQHKRQAHWLHAAWQLSDFKKIKQTILEDQTYSIKGLHSAVGSRPIMIKTSKPGSFMNVNTVQDYEILRAMP